MNHIETVITQKSAEITCNFDQVKEAIKERLAEYEGITFTEESKAYAKKDVASLRKEKKGLQDKLTAEKKRYMEPWERFEVQAKALISIYDEPINVISGQLQAFEEERIAKKKQLITQLYEETVEDSIKEYAPLSRIYDRKWENTTVKEKEIRKALSEASVRIQADLHTIQLMDSEAVLRALELYKKDLNLSSAVEYIHHYESQKKEIAAREEERIRRAEEERIRRAERERLLAEQRAEEEKKAAIRQAEAEKQEALRRAEEERTEALRRAEEVKAVEVERAREEARQEAIENLIPDLDDNTKLYEYRISLSEGAKGKLEMYMDSVGIEWELM